MLNLPNLLTVSRILVIPPMVAAFYLDKNWANIIGCALFVGASLTDFFDGYLARSWSQQSDIGRFLDPVADKLLVAAAILMLVAFDRLHGFQVLAALVILCREILVSGLREFLAELRVGVPVSKLAKWKTGIQMTAIALLLLGETGPTWLGAETVGAALLWIAAGLTLITGYDYLRDGLKHMSTTSVSTYRDHSRDEPDRKPAATPAAAKIRASESGGA
jgi:cardiolipin synthase (CMP-forming)